MKYRRGVLRLRHRLALVPGVDGFVPGAGRCARGRAPFALG
jgi:hypothetical protein